MGVATVIRNNSILEAEDKDVDIEIMSPTNLVGSHPNLVPFVNNAQGARIFYASKFVNQVMPLKNPEAPLIQVNNPLEKRSFESIMGERMGARLWRSDKGGTVKSIDKDKITVTDDAGEDHDVDLYNDFEFNRKTQITNRPVVNVGDKVLPGQLLAASNYTDDNGTLSMGKNARVALIPYKGWSMDDAVVVSESFANRMTSQHSYESSIQKDTDTVFGKNHYASVFPTKFTTKQLENIGDDGIVKPGTVLHKGDPILLATRPKQINSNAEHLGKLGKLFRSIRSDAAEVWEHEYPGYVTDSINGKKNAKAFITAEVPLTLGDKLVTSRPGQKSIVSKIVPDEQMVRSMDGTPFEVLINPLALPSRINTATLFELAMGKVANKQGKPIVIDSFQKKGESRLDSALKMLADAGLKSTEQVYDPVTDKVLAQPVTTGMSYIYKLHHVVESKRSERGQGSYTADFQPAKGGGENAQAKRLGGLEVTALLSKGGYNTLREASTIRGTCFDPSTQVLTRRGWVSWDMVLPTDELYTKNKLDSDTAWFERPLALIKNEFSGDLCGYLGKHLDWLVTPDHHLWGIPYILSKLKRNYCFKTYSADSVYGKEGIIDSFGSIYHGTLPDDYILHFNGTNNRSKSMTMTLYDYCRFMGWYLSEGCCIVDESGRGRVIIAQDEYVHPNEFKEIDTLMRKIGFTNITYENKTLRSPKQGSIESYGHSPAGTRVKIRGNSAPLAKHLLLFGSRAWLKRVPDIIFEASPRARQAFLDAYIKGDGCMRTTSAGVHDSIHYIIGTSSLLMMNDLQRLAVMNGYGAWIGLGKRSGLYLYKHDYYRVILSNNITTLTFRKTPSSKYLGHYKVPYSGYVYCAKMRTGLLYVRRNGKCMWSGNCNDEYWATIRQGYKPADPGVPFVFNKFLALLNGAGMETQNRGNGVLRLKLFTDDDLKSKGPRLVKNGGMIKGDSLDGIDDGLFDKNLVALNGWGYIPLKEPMINPAAENIILNLLQIKEKDLRRVLAGEITLEEARQAK